MRVKVLRQKSPFSKPYWQEFDYTYKENQTVAGMLDELNYKDDLRFVKDGTPIFFIETGGTEQEFKEIYKNYKEPYYLLATNANNSLPASLEIASFLAYLKISFIPCICSQFTKANQ